MSALSTKILLTLAYSAQFSYPLKISQWYVRLIGQGSRDAFVDEAKRLMQSGVVAYSRGWVHLPRKQADIALREIREEASRLKRHELLQLLQLLRYIPWIEGVAITGSAAVNNAGTDDDIDLLIVTAPNRLWLVRPVVIFFAFLKGKRRSWSSEEKNSWCFNLWLERSTLKQPKQTRSLYVAYEVCQADWLLDKNDTQKAFLEANRWVMSYLPQYYYYRKQQRAQFYVPAIKNEVPIISQVLSLLNFLSYIMQRIYMAQHMTRERVSLHMAFFHPRDTRRVISQGLHAIVAAWLNTSF